MKDRIVRLLKKWNWTFLLFLFSRHLYPLTNKNYEKAMKPVSLFLLYLCSLFHKNEFNEVKTFCIFIGNPKSGTTLVGSLLDAHPDIIIANEMQVLSFTRYGMFSVRQVLSILLENSKKITKLGRGWNTYFYGVPNRWQGRYRTLKVIGDKTIATTRFILQKSPFLERLKKMPNIKIKYIHILRNPYDVLAKKAGNSETSIGFLQEVNRYFSICETVEIVKSQINKEDIFETKLEEIIKDPKTQLKKLCNFFEVDCSEDYLRDCEKIVFKKPKKNYSDKWNDERVDMVKKKINEFGFLRGYTYEKPRNMEDLRMDKQETKFWFEDRANR